MANARSGMAVSEECLAKFGDLQRKKAHRFITYKIEKDQIVVDTYGDPSKTYADFQAALPENDCRYAVYDHEFVTDDNCHKSKIFFIAWSPDTSAVKNKMVYASSKDTFRQQLSGVQIELQATDASEMDLDIIKTKALRRRSNVGGSDKTGPNREERIEPGSSGKGERVGRRKWLPKEPEVVQGGKVEFDDRTVEKHGEADQRSGWEAAQEPLEAAAFSEDDAGFGGKRGTGAVMSETAEAAEYRRMERSFGERAQEMDPEELRLARQRVADLIRAGDDVEQEIVRLGREGALNDALILVIQNRLNFARHDNERHVVQCLDLLLRRIEAEREAQQATPALRLLNTLLHLADDLSADISTSSYDQWQREARDAMRAVFLPEDPFMVVMPVVNGMGAPSASTPWNDLGGMADPGASMGGESTLLRIDFIRELEELLEIVEADAAAAAQVISDAFNLPLDDSQETEANGNTTIEEDGGSWGDLDADKVALKLRLEERLRIIIRNWASGLAGELAIPAKPHSSSFDSESLTYGYNVRHDLLERLPTPAVPGGPPSTPKPAPVTLAQSQLNGLIALNAAWRLWPGNGKQSTLCRQWTGIKCNPQGMVTALMWDGNTASTPIEGPIPPAIAAFTALSVLDLPSNAINGTIPVRAFQQLKQLQILDLSQNGLVPPFPARALQYMTALRRLDLHGMVALGSTLDMLGYSTAFQYIDLSYTESKGALPPSLAAASNLSHLDLTYNYPTGTVVSILSNLTSLTFLSIVKAVDLIDDFASFSSLSRLSLLEHLELVSLHNMTGRLEDMTFLTSLPKLRHLHFGDMNVDGELPPELVLLDKLTFLDLSYLYFNDVPLWLGTFTNLRTLAISDSRHLRSGAVPQDLSRLSHLEEFSAVGNGLVGFLPESWASLTALTLLNLKDNGLLGSIPNAFSNLQSLATLDLSINQMSGSLPTSFSPALQYLLLNDNQFEGSLPSALGSLPSLFTLKLGGNSLTGTIPKAFTRLASLKELVLSSNQLSGGLEVIANMLSLATIEIGSNNFSGVLSPEFSKLASLESFDISNNSMTGELPPVLLDLTALMGLDLSYNRLQGSIPDSLTKLVNLQFLHLEHNQFSGELPAFLFQFPALVELYLSDNHFQGSIPQSLDASTELGTLNLEGNSFSGPLPDFAQWNTSLTALYLGFNNFTGSIPDSLTTITSLNAITLHYNQLSGTIPASLSALTALDTIWLAGNQLSGTLPDFFASLSNLRQLLLDGNQISGSLPASFCNLKRLEYFGARNNRMYGPLPRCMFDFLGLNYLDVRNNSFYGTINRDFKGMNNQPTDQNPRSAALNLAYNYFYGEPFVYAAGSMICPTPVVRTVDYHDIASIGATAGGVVAADSSSGRQEYRVSVAYEKGQASLLQNCLAVRGEAGCLVNETQRPAAECAAFCSITESGVCNGVGDCVPPEPGSSDQGFTCRCNAPYSTVPAANGNGSSCAIQTTKSSLSTGAIVGIAVGCFMGLALIAAVLVVMLRKKKRHSGIHCLSHHISTPIPPVPPRQVRAMASLNHKNLVRLLGFCLDMNVESGKQEQILVYEFVANRDFQYHIHKPKRPLTLRQRLKLAVGAAEGLAYLHGFENPIIHRDIKPANILVGDNLTAKIADFGLLKTLKVGDENATRVAGTPGYVDPDYNRTQMVTTKSDVYSFGVVLLEMLTARKVTMGGSSHIGKWVSKMVAAYTLDELRDKTLEIPEEAIVEWADLALDCIKAPGSRRPEMKDVVRRLDALLHKYTEEYEGENDLFGGGDGASSVGSVAGLRSVGSLGGTSTAVGSGISFPSSGVMNSSINSTVQSGVMSGVQSGVMSGIGPMSGVSEISEKSGVSGVSEASGKSGGAGGSTRSKLMMSVASALGISEEDVGRREEGGGDSAVMKSAGGKSLQTLLSVKEVEGR
ncbi:unnamed protein product [Closterium sp. Yama58-4]|nr:unnamed protein product [Closterium sp. Yama58-4]